MLVDGRGNPCNRKSDKAEIYSGNRQGLNTVSSTIGNVFALTVIQFSLPALDAKSPAPFGCDKQTPNSDGGNLEDFSDVKPAAIRSIGNPDS